VVSGGPSQGAGSGIGYRDETLTTPAAGFAQMATQVREREEASQWQVKQLRIEIDEVKKQSQVDEIVESDHVQPLRAKAASLRQKREQGSNPRKGISLTPAPFEGILGPDYG